MEELGNLSAMLSGLLSNPQAMQQIQSMAAALGLGGQAGTGNQGAPFQGQGNPFQGSPSQGQGNPFQGSPSQGQGNPSQGQSTPSQTAAPPPPNGGMGGLNTEGLMGMLSQLGFHNPGQAAAPPGAASPAAALPNLDLNTIVKIQQAMQMFLVGNKNVDLLRSLKPHLSEKRAKKVDDAVRIMQLIHMLPLIKQSGIFGFGGDGR